MNSVVKLLKSDFTPSKSECQRVTIWMGETACVAERVVLMPEYEINCGVISVFLVIYKLDGSFIDRISIDTSINLTPFGVPTVLFAKAITYSANDKPEKLMIDAWLSSYYMSQQNKKPLIKPHDGVSHE